MKKINVEAELKYRVDVDSIDSLLFHPAVSRLLILPGQHGSFAIRSVYYDTYDQLLRAHKVVLRRRRANTGFFLTMKAPIAEHDGIYLRKEWEFELSGDDCLIDLQKGLEKEWFLRRLRDQGKAGDDDVSLLTILDNIAGMRLREVCGSDFMRLTYRLHYKQSLFELAFDQGYLFARDRNLPFEEIELELIDGKMEDISELNKLWLNRLPISPNTRTKYERAIALFDEQ